MKIADYVTTEDVEIQVNFTQTKKLPQGSFVKPISSQYLPRHIVNSSDYQYTTNYDSGKFLYVYCHFGIVKIPADIIRAV